MLAVYQRCLAFSGQAPPRCLYVPRVALDADAIPPEVLRGYPVVPLPPNGSAHHAARQAQTKSVVRSGLRLLCLVLSLLTYARRHFKVFERPLSWYSGLPA